MLLKKIYIFFQLGQISIVISLSYSDGVFTASISIPSISIDKIGKAFDVDLFENSFFNTTFSFEIQDFSLETTVEDRTPQIQ